MINKQFLFTVITCLFLVTSCGIYKKVNTRETPVNAIERAKKMCLTAGEFLLKI